MSAMAVHALVTNIHYASEDEPRRRGYLYGANNLGVPERAVLAVVNAWQRKLLSGMTYFSPSMEPVNVHELARVAVLAVLESATAPSPLQQLFGERAADQSFLPAHLRDDAPWQRCDRCGRKSWAVTEQFDKTCGFPQPDGSTCAGIFRSAS